jgi:hypothetical protein
MPATDALTIRRARITTRRYRTTSPRPRATTRGARITTRRARITILHAHGTTRRRRTTIRTRSPSPRATIRRARTTTRHTRATIRHVRILVHDAKETRLLPARIRTTKRLDPVRRSSGLRPRGALDLAIAKGWLALHESGTYACAAPRCRPRVPIAKRCIGESGVPLPSVPRFHAGVWFATAARWRWTGAISVSLSLTFGTEPRPAEGITGEHQDARNTALG